MIRLGVSGACGRMGQTIVKLAEQDQRFEITCVLDKKDHPDAGKAYKGSLKKDRPLIVTDAADDVAYKNVDVFIDFSNPPKGEMLLLKNAERYRKSIVIGTTGFSEIQMKSIEKVTSTIAVLLAANMSIGAVLMAELAKRAAEVLGSDYQIRVDEAHHVHKKDKPSGTALYIGKEICAAKKWDHAKAAYFDWEHKGQAAPQNRVTYSSRREGEIIGEHDAIFEGLEEKIEIRHQAHSRDAFARGALQAAAFITKQRPGRYRMEDVLQFAREQAQTGVF